MNMKNYSTNTPLLTVAIIILGATLAFFLVLLLPAVFAVFLQYWIIATREPPQPEPPPPPFERVEQDIDNYIAELMSDRSGDA